MVGLGSLHLNGEPHLLRIFTSVILLTLSACGSHRDSADASVELRVGDQLGTLQTLLKSAGEDKPQGYRISWSGFVGGPAVIAAETGGSVDIGWMNETPLVFAQAAGSPVKVVGVARPIRPQDSLLALIVPINSPIRSVSDLKGRKVAFLRGTVAHYFIASLLEQAGLSMSDIQPVNLPAVSPALLENGTVDATVTVDPHLSQMLVNEKARIVATGGEPLTREMQFAVASDRALADPQRRAAIGDFLTRAARAMRFRRDHPERAAPIYAQSLNLPRLVIDAFLKRAPTHFVPIDDQVIAAQQTIADRFLKMGLIRNRPDAARLFDRQYNGLIAKAESAQ